MERILVGIESTLRGQRAAPIHTSTSARISERLALQFNGGSLDVPNDCPADSLDARRGYLGESLDAPDALPERS